MPRRPTSCGGRPSCGSGPRWWTGFPVRSGCDGHHRAVHSEHLHRALEPPRAGHELAREMGTDRADTRAVLGARLGQAREQPAHRDGRGPPVELSPAALVEPDARFDGHLLTDPISRLPEDTEEDEREGDRWRRVSAPGHDLPRNDGHHRLAAPTEEAPHEHLQHLRGFARDQGARQPAKPDTVAHDPLRQPRGPPRCPTGATPTRSNQVDIGRTPDPELDSQRASNDSRRASAVQPDGAPTGSRAPTPRAPRRLPSLGKLPSAVGTTSTRRICKKPAREAAGQPRPQSAGTERGPAPSNTAGANSSSSR